MWLWRCLHFSNTWYYCSSSSCDTSSASFIKRIAKIDETTIDDAKDLYLVKPMYNLIEYSLNYSETTGRLYFYSKDEVINFNFHFTNNDNFKPFEYNAKLLGNPVAQLNRNHANAILKTATIGVPLKYLSNFWRSLEMSLINCKAELKLKWTKHCVLSAAGNDNVNMMIPIIFFYYQLHKTICSSCNFISKR